MDTQIKYFFIIFFAGLIPRPLGRKERTLWPEAKDFLVRGLGGVETPFQSEFTRSVSPCCFNVWSI